jgi:hypothetical protein
LIASTAAAACLHLQSTGCGTGSNWCTVGQTYCETGFSSNRTGCGHDSTSTRTRDRKCYKITKALTAACDPGYHGPEDPTGCAPQTGVCCFAEYEELAEGPGGQLVEPMGPNCECGTAFP